MMNIRLYLVSSLAALLFIAPSASADTIYLKDGTILKGKILTESETSVSVEMTDTWKKIDRGSIELIKKDSPEAAKPLPPVEPAKTEPSQQVQSAAPSRTIGDLRIRLGNAPGITETKTAGLTIPSTAEEGGNFQMDFVVGLYKDSSVGLVLAAGIFSRMHAGYDTDAPPTHIDYDAAGVNLGIGIGIKASETVHFEGRAEMGLGRGKPTFTPSLGPLISVEPGGYSSFTFIAGAYVTLGKPGFQVGVEVGTQSFGGRFTIQDIFGQSISGMANGSGGIANLVLGYRFF